MIMIMQRLQLRLYAARFFRAVRSCIADCVVPPQCAFCRIYMSDRLVLCDACMTHVTPVVSVGLAVTATKEVRVFAVSEYKDPLRSMILAKNHSDIVAARQLGQLMWERTYIKNLPFEYIVAIPAHWSRSAKRGYNQSVEMARVISRLSGKPLVQPVVRTKRTKLQAELNKELRASNVREAFEICGDTWEMLQGKHILVVDDLLTTGATMKAVVRQLYTLKPSAVSAVVACRVV